MSLFLSYSLFVSQNLFVLCSAWILTLIVFKRLKWSFLSRFLVLTIFWSLIVILSQQLLGVFGILTFPNLFVFHLLEFVGLMIFAKKSQIKLLESVNFAYLKTLSKKELLFSLIVFLPLFALVAGRFVNALYQIPAEYDNLAYHLPFVVEWLRTGDLKDIYYSAFAGPISYYPSNFELLDLYVMLPFNSDLLVNLLNFPLIILNGIAFYAVLSLLSVKRNLSLAITALFLTTPLLLRQVGVPLVDLYFNFTFITAIYFLIHYFKNRDEKALYFFALALGLFIGVKYLGLVYAAPLLLVAGIAYVIYQKPKLHTLGKKVIQITVLCLIGGGFWYIRNWISVGNPIYPAGVELMGHTILKGYAPINENLAAFSLSANLNSAVRWQEFFMKFTSMLAYSSYLFIVAGFLLLWKGLKDFKQKGYVALMLLLAMLVYFYLYLKSPYSYNNLIPNVRYALMFVCFAFWGLAYSLKDTSIKIQNVLGSLFWVLSVVGIYNFILHPPNFILNNDRILFDLSQFLNSGFLILILVFIGALLLGLIFLKQKLHLYLLSLVMIFFLSFSVLSESVLLRENFDTRSKLYETWYGDYQSWHDLLKSAEWFEQNGLDNAKIAYTGFNFHYPFFGRNLAREVDYVNINDCTECRYGDFANKNLTIRNNPDYDKWLYNLENLGKEYVVVEPKITDTVVNHEFDWIRQHPEKFELAFQLNSIYIYKIL